MNQKQLFQKAVYLSLIFCVFLQAQDIEMEALMKMDLQELLAMEVSSATKSSVSLQKSPGIIRVFTREDFERYGMRTLADVLAYVPGIQLQRSYKNSTSVWIRGIQTRYNNKVLLMIDKVPIRECYYGSFDIDESVPLENVERIEVINGPGSVMYGANAFAGVISVTTVKKGRSVKIGYTGGPGKGPQDKTFGNYNVYAQADYKDIYLYGQYSDGTHFHPELTARDGYPYPHDSDYRQLTATLKYTNEAIGLSALGTFNDIRIPDVYGDMYTDSDESRSPIYGSIELDRELVSVGRLYINPYVLLYKLNSTGREYLDSYERDDENEVEVAPEDKILSIRSETKIQTLIWGMNAEWSRKFSASNSVAAGVSFQQDRSIDRFPGRETEETEYRDGQFVYGDWIDEKDYKLKADVARTTTGVFMQDLWEISPAILATTGVRYDILSDFDDQFNYRLGLTTKTATNLYGKLLAGSAYRVPLLREYLKEGMENPQLQPERILTAEGQIGYLAEWGDMNITAYYNRYSDYIGEVAIVKLDDEIFWEDEDDPSEGLEADEYYMNFKERQIIGLEWFSQFYMFNGLGIGFTANTMLKATENMGTSLPSADEMSMDDLVNTSSRMVMAETIDQDEKDLVLLSKIMASCRISYKYRKSMIGLNFRYNSRQPTPSNWHTDEDVSENLDDYGISLKEAEDNKNSFWEIDLHGSAEVWNNLSLCAGVRNLLDNRSFAPNFSKITEYDVERIGRRFEVSALYRF